MANAQIRDATPRFLDVDQENDKLIQPIKGYRDLPLVTLEEAIEPIVQFCPDVRRQASIAKGRATQPKDGLTKDESAAIFLYTSEWTPREKCLYVRLNWALRSSTCQQLLPPWFLYIKLLLVGLSKLRSSATTVWRGVPRDVRQDYEVGKRVIWWGFSSCTKTMSVLESSQFFGQEGKRTMFSIECFHGKKIREHSSIPSEDEILLLPGSQFIVKSHFKPSNKDSDMIIIQLRQVKPPFPLLEDPTPVARIDKRIPVPYVGTFYWDYQYFFESEKCFCSSSVKNCQFCRYH